MRRALGYGMTAVVVLLALLCLCVTAAAQSESASTGTESSSGRSTITSQTSDGDARHTTCRSGTVNYITHSLPQQCLTRTTSPTTNSTTITTTTPSTAATVVPSSPVSQDSSTPTASSSATQPEAEFETDSPLDNANFLSFEEWKKQNLAKVGQSPDHVGQQSRSSQDKPRKIPHINNALDVLGEDSEIELDFGGFGRQDSAPSPYTNPEPPASSGLVPRSKDAGKTCKERSNYASFDCAATVLKSNPESKSASAVLIENKDSYMLNICQSPNKFLIVELCNDILIDTIVLANYEFFSSIFRTFRVSVSDRYPVKLDRWKELGVFEARNTRSVQAFLVEQPLIWARYLRIEFLTHYGNEYYCPVSLLRVHGTTMMEEFRHQEDLNRGEISDDLEESVMPDASGSSAQEPPESSKDADSSVVIESVKPLEHNTVDDTSSTPVFSSDSATKMASSEDSSQTISGNPAPSESSDSSSPHSQASTNVATSGTPPVSNTTAASQSSPTQQTTQDTKTQSLTSQSPSSKAQIVESPSPSNNASNTSIPTVSSAQESLPKSNSTNHMPESPVSNTAIRSVPLNSTSRAATNATSSKGTSIPSKPSSAASEPQQKSGTSTVSSAHSNPTTQESFFKSVHKRLQMLESNATLSLQYIEEQSRMLRDVWMKSEKRQIKKTEAFLNNLNATVFAELQDFKQQYDQLWQSTVIELENHREQYQREILAVSARLSIVADELVFQKRMAIIQSTLLMLCLGLVLFVRAGGGAGLDIPIIQQMVNKSQFGTRSSYYSPLNSPSLDQNSPPAIGRNMRRRRGFWRSSIDTSASARPTSRGNGNVSEASIEEHARRENPDLSFEPPTPTYDTNNATDGEDGVMVSPAPSSIREDLLMDHELSGDEMDVSSSSVPQIQSSPSTPSGSRDRIQPQWPSDGDIGDAVIEAEEPAEDSPQKALPDTRLVG